MSDRYDVIIIGSGAGGGTLLSALAPTGKKILVLERGEFLPREKENWDSRSVLVEGRYKTGETWLDRDGNVFHPSTHYWVGGNTKVYGAALIRFRKENMAHLNSIFFAVTTRRNDTVFQKTLALNDFYFRSDDWDHPLGHISMVGKSDGHFLKAGAKFAPLFLLERVARHAFDFWLTSEDLPDRDNRVTVEQDGQIRLSYTPNNLEGHARLTARLKRIVKELLPLGITIAARMPVAATAHQCGTVRFGTDPATSVLDVHCKAHEVDNLYVVDAGFFPSSAAVNPALTIMANALRVADHLKTRLAS